MPTSILPTSCSYSQHELPRKSCPVVQLNQARIISDHIQNINNNVEAMIEARKRANNNPHIHQRALMYCHEVKIFFHKIRYHADKLELIVDDKLWPLTKYRELLYLR